MKNQQSEGLGALRAELDRIDDDILALIERRLAVSTAVAERKQADGGRHLKIRPRRQVEVLQRLNDRAARAGPELIAKIWRELMGHSLQAQERTEIVLAPSDSPELLEARVRAHFGSAAWCASN